MFQKDFFLSFIGTFRSACAQTSIYFFVFELHVIEYCSTYKASYEDITVHIIFFNPDKIIEAKTVEI